MEQNESMFVFKNFRFEKNFYSLGLPFFGENKLEVIFRIKERCFHFIEMKLQIYYHYRSVCMYVYGNDLRRKLI